MARRVRSFVGTFGTIMLCNLLTKHCINGAMMDCTLDACKPSISILSDTDIVTATCGKETQQIIVGVYARFYDTSLSPTMNATCNNAFERWSSESPENSAVSCDVSAAVFSNCENEIDCSISPSDFTDCTIGGTNKAVDLVLDCGDAGIDMLTIFVLLMLVAVALAMGTVTSREDFEDIVKEKKKAFFIGFASQFGFMPLFSFTMAHLMGFSNLESVGICLCGCAPGGSTSNLFTYWAGGNVSLSIAMSAASTIASFLMLPLLFQVYIKSTFAKDLEAELPWSNMAIVLFSIVIPVLIGIYIKQRNANTAWYIEKFGGAMGALFLLVSLVFGIYENQKLFDVTVFWKAWILALLFQPVGCLFGLFVSRILNMDVEDSIAIALETGVQNYAVSLAVVVLSLEGCDRAEALTFVLCAMAFYLIHSPVIATILSEWKKRVPGKFSSEDVDSNEMEKEFWWARTGEEKAAVKRV